MILYDIIMFSQMVWWFCSLQQEVPLFAMLPWNRSDFQGTIRHQDATITIGRWCVQKIDIPMEFPRISWWTHHLPSHNSGFLGVYNPLFFHGKKNTPQISVSGFRLPQGRVDPARVLPGDDHHGIDRQKLVALVEGLQIWEIPWGIDTAPFQRWRIEMKKLVFPRLRQCYTWL